MFAYKNNDTKHHDDDDDNKNSKSKPKGRPNAGATPFHRRQSYIPRDKPETRPRFKWHFYDNNGSFNGWFDWLPLWMRVGYFSPFVVAALMFVYTAIVWFRPLPLEFAPSALENSTTIHDDANSFHFMGMPKETAMDLFLFCWGVIVVVHAKVTLQSIGGFFISFTGWSWSFLTLRAGLEFSAWAAASLFNNHEFATQLAIAGSSLRFVAITNACVVCTIWNCILLPIIYFVSMPPGEKRDNFRKFNFGFFMTNIHILNFPMAVVNTIYGSRVRVFTMSDLWVGYLVCVVYSIVYFFVMDRIGLHFYPILCPRSAFSVVSMFGVLGLYYFLFMKWNEIISSQLDVPSTVV